METYQQLETRLEEVKNRIRELNGNIPDDNITPTDKSAQAKSLTSQVKMLSGLIANKPKTSSSWLAVYELERQAIIAEMCSRKYQEALATPPPPPPAQEVTPPPIAEENNNIETAPPIVETPPPNNPNDATAPSTQEQENAPLETEAIEAEIKGDTEETPKGEPLKEVEYLGEEIGKLNFVVSGVTIDEKYPDLADANKYQTTFQTSDDIYTIYVSINYVIERLYFNIQNGVGDSIITYCPLIENVNLVNSILEKYELYFKNNIFYFKEL